MTSLVFCLLATVQLTTATAGTTRTTGTTAKATTQTATTPTATTPTTTTPTATTPTATDCDACFNGTCQQKISVLEGMEQIGQLAIDRTANILYFHMKDHQSLSHTCVYDLNNINLDRIWDVDFTFARTVDQDSRDLYLSRERNVIKMNPDEGYVNGINLFNKTIWHMQYKNALYYKEYKVPGISVYENGVHRKVEPLSEYDIDDFIVDKFNDIYFVANFSLYRLKSGEAEVKLIAGQTYELSTDKYEDAYFLEPFTKGLYKLDYYKDEIVLFGAFAHGTPYRIVFTKENNVLYSDIDLNSMYLLVPGTNSCKLNPKTEHKKMVTFTVNPK